MDLGLIIFSFILFGVTIFLLFKMMWHLWHMIQNLTGKYSGFLGFFVLFMPNQFSAVGNKHREKFIYFLLLTIVSFICLFGLKTYIEK